MGNGFCARSPALGALPCCWRSRSLSCRPVYAQTEAAVRCSNLSLKEPIGSFLLREPNPTSGRSLTKMSSNLSSEPDNTHFRLGSGDQLNTLPDRDPTLRDLLRIFHRRKRSIIVTASVVFLLSVCACVLMTRRYTARGVIQLQK